MATPDCRVVRPTYAGADQTELITQTGRTYAYGHTNTAGVLIIESYNSSQGQVSYTYDPQGTPLAVEGTNSHYLALDGLGSPVALVNSSGGQTAAYSYDPYGGATATAVNGSGAIGIQIFGYAGGFDDPTSGLVHFGERWYDPATGRFTQQDSLETLADPSRANRYEYAAGNPINYVDPTGRLWCEALVGYDSFLTWVATSVPWALTNPATPTLAVTGAGFLSVACATEYVL